ncbi:MAG: ribosome maturation factor RimM [Anaerolineae bacterium]|nr:ribosome maturation factor RimM [Anaerolineae bacterium]
MTDSLHPDYLVIGEILRPHGIVGELRTRLLTQHPEHLKELDSVYLANSPESKKVTKYTVEKVRLHQGYALFKFDGINDRDAADRLRQLFVMVALENAVPLDEGEFYLYQLIGLNVQTEDGLSLGKLTEVLETGANDVYIVDSPRYGEVLIPVTNETILETNIERGFITVKLPDGLLPPI